LRRTQEEVMEDHALDAERHLPEGLSGLYELALNLRWTWDRETRALFREIDPELWDQIEDNPWLMLRANSRRRLEELAGDAAFAARVERCHGALQSYLAERGWFHQAHPEEEALVAYFTAECGLTECLPIYAGGLGILSGDHLKAASALGVPLVGVSLLYQEGYGRQVLDASGWQLDRFPSNRFDLMPLRVERTAEGRPLVVEVPLPGRSLSLLVWSAQVGRVTLYLLDANILTNNPSDRGITGQLYGGDREMRLQQEMALGIGGWRALAALGLRPQVCHLNEGHAAFAVLERARDLMGESGCTFWQALAATAAGNVFTTHTPVPAGFDRFAPELVARMLAPYAAELGISVGELIGLGRIDPPNWDEPFNMALLALNHVNSCNGVSRLHAEVSRQIFRPRFPRFPDWEIPITAVTNGIHTDSWLAEGMERLLKQYVGPEVDEHPEEARWEGTAGIPDGELWEALNLGRRRLVDFARERLRRQMAQRGVPPEEAAARSEQVLDPNVLTIGFARRFASYKRATLFMRDPERLRRLLLDPERPAQLVIAGKAHPQDDSGKALIQQVVRFAEGEDVRQRIVFLEDYDMRVTGRMVQGVDVWLNTPRRPMEASGTSGMKVLPNGGLNLSIRDGWWAEAYEPGVGWAFGVDDEGMNPEQQDALDAVQLYETLEREVVPLYYDRGPDGVPHGWIGMVKNAMRRLCPRFNTNRMVRQYVEEHYLPAARHYRTVTADGLVRAKSLAVWEATVRAYWGDVRIEDAAASPENGVVRFRARVHLGAVRPEDVAAQAYADPTDGAGPEIAPMSLVAADGGSYWYEGQAPAMRPPGDFTVRLLPYHPDARQPLDVPLVRWEH
jgi:starch phosphorylase